MNAPSVENPELTNVVLPLKTGTDQNIARHASPIARSICLVQFSTFRSIHLHFFYKLFPCLFNALVLANAVFRVGLWNKIARPAHHHNRLM